MGLRKRRPAIQMDRVYLGRILKPHGLHGEVKFCPFGCDPWILETLGRIELESPDLSVEVEYVRGTEKAPIVKFKTIEDRDASETLNGAVVWIAESSLPELEEDAFYESDILFARVVTVSGEELGHVQVIIETGECDVLVVRNRNGKEWLLPANRAVIKEIRKSESTLVVEPPEYAEPDNAD